MQKNIQETLQSAIEMHRAGRDVDAEKLYRSILLFQPNHPEANHNLGVLALLDGRTDVALSCFELALQADPARGQFWVSYVDALIRAGRLSEARETLSIATDSGLEGDDVVALAARLDREDSTGGSQLKKEYDGDAVTTAAATQGLRNGATKSKVRKPSPPGESSEIFVQQVAPLVTLFGQGKYQEVETKARVIVAGHPVNGYAWGMLGIALQQLGRNEEALIPLRESVRLLPDDPLTLGNLGNTLSYLGRFTEAEEMLRRAIAINEDYPEGYVNLGTTLLESHRYEEAEACYRRAVALKPDLVDGHYNLGNTLKCLERHAEASTCFRRALELRPGWERALNNLGVALYKMGRMEDAEASLERAIESNPDYVESYANLGLVQHERGQLDKACETYDKALRIRTRLPQILSNYGVTLHAMGRLFEAEQIYLKALASDPEFPDALSNLGTLLQDMGRFDEAIGCYRRILELSPTHLRVRSRLLFIYNYLGSYSAKQYVDEAGRYGELARSLVTISYAHELPETQPARLRVGLVSGDLRNHPVGYFLEGVLVALSSKDVELYAYQSYYKTDELTSRIKPLFAAWRTIYDLGDSAAARVIRDDGIHVLIDMSGHTQHNRLPLFSWKPAPVQVSWLGYFATTGVAEIDYLIGDPYVTPAHETAHFAESIWTLPKSYWCFSVPACTLEVARLPATGVGYITFGCFNNLNKMNDAVVSAWARILYRVPGSRLYLKYTQLGDAKMRDITIARFAEHGICPERLILEGASSRAEYLACFNKVDIALDPFPYPGGTTTIEGLWMGVPFITKAGDRFLSHAGETIAHNAGLSDWIAEDEDEYVRMAVHHASDLSRLAELRAVLRDQVLKSPLFDASGFAGHFEQAMWGMWQRWQGGYQ